MASTKLIRKALRNRAVAKQRQDAMKRLTSKPVIKNVDIEQIKEEFAKKKAAPAPKKEAPVEEKAPKAAPKAEATPEVKEEKKAAPKKAAAKKAAPKAKKEAAPKAEKKEDSAE